MRSMCRAMLLAAAMGVAPGAWAQTPLTGTTGAPTAAVPGASIDQGAVPRRRAHRTLQERFDEANTTHDGHLTAEQARSKMPAVARDFAAIDAEHKGYVTVDQIRAHAAAARAARRAAKEHQ